MALAPGELLARESSLSSLAAAKPKGEKVKIAYIGIGNRGQQIIEEFAKTGMVEVVALCDVDLDGKQCEKVLSMYPKAKRFRDFREMFDKCGS
jgi:predicted dehydrogenase